MKAPRPSRADLARARKLARPSTLRSLAREAAWRAQGARTVPLRPTWQPDPRWLETATVTWPEQYRWPPQASWVEPIRLGLEPLVRVTRAPLFADTRGVVPFHLNLKGRVIKVAIDYGDDPSLNPALLADFELVFKMQYLIEGYGSQQVVAGGFVPNALSLYRYLPHLRARRDKGPLSDKAYGRFGEDKVVPVRERAVELLRSQNQFPYRGGFGRIRYAQGLTEAASAGVCIDLPGLGPLCFRLVDYLAVGVPIVAVRHACCLHVPLEDGEQIVYCSADLSDFVDTIDTLLQDRVRAAALAHRARDFFDRYLDYRQLARYYLATLLERA